MRLDDALSRIGEIHAQIVRGELFRGYRALPTAITGFVALSAAGVQDRFLPALEPAEFVRFWVVIAVLCALLIAADFAVQFYARAETLKVRRTATVVAQFAPATFAAGALTYAWRDGPLCAVLPAVWSMGFGLGVLASRPYLPRAIGGVVAFYLLAAIGLGLTAEPGLVPSPWSMGLTFGIGQFGTAAVLYLCLERKFDAQLGGFDGR